MKYKKLIQYFRQPRKFLLLLLNMSASLWSDKFFLQLKYYSIFGHHLNLKPPKTFNEKLQWLKLYDRRSEYTLMVDKIDAKKYVASIIGEEHIIPTIAVYEKVEDIDFDKLPNQFVMKCTHNSNSIVICKNKSTLDKRRALRKLKKGLKRNYYWKTREFPYKGVKPRIIVEKFIADYEGDLKDYKFFCFNGKPHFFKIDFDRFIEHHANYYDLFGNILPFGEAAFKPLPNRTFMLPPNFDDMISFASTLAKKTSFVRIDFYNVKGHIFFGEITFYPASGLGKIEPEEWDLKLGNMLKLPTYK